MEKRKIIAFSGAAIAVIAIFSSAFWFVTDRENDAKKQNQKNPGEEMTEMDDNNKNQNVSEEGAKTDEDSVEINTKKDANKAMEEMDTMINSISEF